eukprot:TRINITY_DN1167_c0_g1_i1.p1 TRINITY_DN1167_c0_g1~~TRINITY_DN1167_c0_g1_i1.p1  ORF type:complete len:189 (-),score=106.66 TRINITY_DN1167_c0_g1_i1:88-654(-)
MNTQPVSAASYPVTTPVTTSVTPQATVLPSGETITNPSSIKGNITAMVGKMSHNPEKEVAGNTMVAGAKEQKAARFEAKALEWERKGNVQKAQKNREKAAKFRQAAMTKLTKPVQSVGVATAPGQKADKAARCDAKALEYERKGNMAKAQKNRERAYKIRSKHGITHPVGTVPMTSYGTTTMAPAPIV